MLKKKNKIILLIILLCALALRLTGITHGFPFIFHPDEPTIVRSALGIRFNLNPKHFDWPHLYIYFNYFFYMIFSRFRNILEILKLKESFRVLFPLTWDDTVIFYYLTRCLSAMLGALTVIPVYLSAKKLFSGKAALFAAFCMAFLPYHVWHSHYSLGDVPMVFLLSWGLYFSCFILEDSKLKNYVFSGFFIGLAASIKYNGGLSALMVPTAHFLGILRKKQSDGEKAKILDFRGISALFLSGVSALAGFLIGTPFALLDFKTFSRTDGPKGAFWQFTNVGSVSFSEHFSQFFNELFISVANNMGWVTIIAFVLTLAYSIFRIARRKVGDNEYKLIFLCLNFLLLFWYISGFKNTRAHYYFIFYPFAAVIFGFFVSQISTWLNTKKKLYSLLFVFLMCFPLVFFSVRNSYSFYRGDTRNDLYKWLVSNLKLGENVFYNDTKASDVFGELGVNAKKNFDGLKSVSSALVVVLDPENSTDFLSKNSSYLVKEESFSNKLRLGPNIEIYRYQNEEIIK
ncbi:MAG: glycosyltransferase family 39 protein [Patescibacteria group bacterium]